MPPRSNVGWINTNVGWINTCTVENLGSIDVDHCLSKKGTRLSKKKGVTLDTLQLLIY